MQWSTLKAWLEFELINVGSYTLNTYQIISALVVIGLGMLVVHMVNRALNRVADFRGTMSGSQIYTISRLLGYTLYTITGMLALSMLGISFEKMALVAGALSVGIGFGLQNIVNNFVSGIIILFERSLRVGDFVELESGLVGEVREIRIRSTVIRTLGNEDILVPNSTFISSQVNNWTLDDDYKRINVPFGVAYGTDPRLVIREVIAAAVTHPNSVREPGRDPNVIFTGFGDSSLDFKLVVWIRGEWVKRPGQVLSDYLLMIHDVLAEHGIEVPFPQRDLHIRSGLTPMSAPLVPTDTLPPVIQAGATAGVTAQPRQEG